jgi:hypothetical protein
MALLQVRNFPDEMYGVITALAKAERRTIAQQTILLIENGLTAAEMTGNRRRAAVERSMSRSIPHDLRNTRETA